MTHDGGTGVGRAELLGVTVALEEGVGDIGETERPVVDDTDGDADDDDVGDVVGVTERPVVADTDVVPDPLLLRVASPFANRPKAAKNKIRSAEARPLADNLCDIVVIQSRKQGNRARQREQARV